MKPASKIISVGMAFNPYRLFNGAVIPNCLLRCKTLSAYAKLVWSRLAQFNGKNGRCVPSLTLISEETGISRSTVIRVIEELVQKGFLAKISPSYGDRLDHKTNSYQILLHQVFFNELAPENENNEELDGTPGVSGRHQAGVNQTPPYKAVEENQGRESTPLSPPRGGELPSGPDNGEELMPPHELAASLNAFRVTLARGQLNTS